MYISVPFPVICVVFVQCGFTTHGERKWYKGRHYSASLWIRNYKSCPWKHVTSLSWFY